MTFLGVLESDIEKVGGFIVKEIQAAENLLGAKTGNQKLNLVVTAVETGLTALGVPIAAAAPELAAVVNALVALLNKTGIMASATAQAKAPATAPKP